MFPLISSLISLVLTYYNPVTITIETDVVFEGGRVM
jgi:hypothetical protein